ncbi:E3 ubiquitin-protein ligase MARCHF2-like [Haemaphysalis longicornis]
MRSAIFSSQPPSSRIRAHHICSRMLPCGSKRGEMAGSKVSATGSVPCESLASTPIGSGHFSVDWQSLHGPEDFSSLPSPVGCIQVGSATPGAALSPGAFDEETVPLSPTWRVGSADVTASSGPICRICHEGDHLLPLLSICLCAGTIGLVHLPCLEHWLSASGSETCELCHYRFNVVHRPRRFDEWLHIPDVRRCFLVDVACFGLLSPLAFLCGVLCLHGAAQQLLLRHLWESIGLVTLAFLLFTVYGTWTVLAFRYHYTNWRKWREANSYVRVVDMPRCSGPVAADGKLLRYELGESPAPHTTTRLPRAAATSVNSGSRLDSSFEICSPNSVVTSSTVWEYRMSRL